MPFFRYFIFIYLFFLAFLFYFDLEKVQILLAIWKLVFSVMQKLEILLTAMCQHSMELSIAPVGVRLLKLCYSQQQKASSSKREKKTNADRKQIGNMPIQMCCLPSDVWTCGTYLCVVHNIKFDLNAATIYGICLRLYSRALRWLNCFGQYYNRRG